MFQCPCHLVPSHFPATISISSPRHRRTRFALVSFEYGNEIDSAALDSVDCESRDPVRRYGTNPVAGHGQSIRGEPVRGTVHCARDQVRQARWLGRRRSVKRLCGHDASLHDVLHSRGCSVAVAADIGLAASHRATPGTHAGPVLPGAAQSVLLGAAPFPRATAHRLIRPRPGRSLFAIC